MVDDEPFIRLNLVDAIISAGMQADDACDAEEAVELLNVSTYDLVLTDVKMPGPFDGRELADRIRRAWPATRVALMSGHFDEAGLPPDLVCIRKPFSVDSLVTRLAHLGSSNGDRA